MGNIIKLKLAKQSKTDRQEGASKDGRSLTQLIMRCELHSAITEVTSTRMISQMPLDLTFLLPILTLLSNM
jgi:hypothetical protein